MKTPKFIVVGQIHSRAGFGRTRIHKATEYYEYLILCSLVVHGFFSLTAFGSTENLPNWLPVS